MKKYIQDKNNRLDYELVGDYYLPCLKAPESPKVGRFGLIYLDYLRKHKRTTYSGLMLSGKLICVGFFSMVFAQVLINVGMCTSLLPVIGVTLPFFSAGGTSLLCMFMGVGLVLNVYKHTNLRTLYLHE